MAILNLPDKAKGSSLSAAEVNAVKQVINLNAAALTTAQQTAQQALSAITPAVEAMDLSNQMAENAQATSETAIQMATAANTIAQAFNDFIEQVNTVIIPAIQQAQTTANAAKAVTDDFAGNVTTALEGLSGYVSDGSKILSSAMIWVASTGGETVTVLGDPVLILTVIDHATIKADWTSDPNATNHILTLSTSADFSGATQVYQGNLNTFNIGSLQPSTQYYVRVKSQATGYAPSGYDTETATTQAAPVSLTHIVLSGAPSANEGGQWIGTVTAHFSNSTTQTVTNSSTLTVSPLSIGTFVGNQLNVSTNATTGDTRPATIKAVYAGMEHELVITINDTTVVQVGQIVYRKTFPNPTTTPATIGTINFHGSVDNAGTLTTLGTATAVVRPEVGKGSIVPINSGTTVESETGFFALGVSCNRSWIFTREYTIVRGNGIELKHFKYFQGHSSASWSTAFALEIDGVWYLFDQGNTNPAVLNHSNFAAGAIQITYTFDFLTPGRFKTLTYARDAQGNTTAMAVGTTIAGLVPAGNITGVMMVNEGPNGFVWVRMDTLEFETMAV